MSEPGTDDWSDYETGPFCRHWSHPADCDVLCGNCGHGCAEHDAGCRVEGCNCGGWKEPE